MADEAVVAPEVPMEVESEAGIAADPTPTGNSDEGCSKRAREEENGAEENVEKRTKLEEEKPGEEQRLESSGDGEGKTGEQEEEKETNGATVGAKTFGSSAEMFDYFYKLLHSWTPFVNINKYEHKVLLELLKKGHVEADRKIGKGIKQFQVRFHPRFKSRCFFLIREDDVVDDFSFRKCVDHILPLPENMQVKHEVNRAFNGRGGQGRGHGRRGR